MHGTLHIFRRNVVNGSPVFQVNYNRVENSFAKVFGTKEELREFLIVAAALDPDEVEDVWAQLTGSGSANIDGVDIKQSDAIANGMVESPTDF